MSCTIDGALLIPRKIGLCLGKEKGIKQTLLMSVAILPQLFINKTGEAETITAHYLFLGLSCVLYLVHWLWRFCYFDLIAVVAGAVQPILYCDFFYLYITKETQSASVSAKDHEQPLSFRVLGQDSHHSESMDAQ
ncbi:ER lumen protein-retaining receptor 2 [Microtus ochrogaster]|uniref:ER lumen protein-retaining receptor 2 n=1 Tax=Microtus ochrogaster TaxID=79684 RepID=A0A8J6H2I7_MICOH|nr:ER lumen protein-retaining receptor 2 [Microtus ochrogaster]